GDLADLVVHAGRVHRISVPRDAFAGHFESDQFARHAGFLLRDQDACADEPARLVELDDPTEARLERRVQLVHVVAVEAERYLEAQRIARAQAARLATL